MERRTLDSLIPGTLFRFERGTRIFRRLRDRERASGWCRYEGMNGCEGSLVAPYSPVEVVEEPAA